MTINGGTDTLRRSTPELAAPPAMRVRRPRWRHPQLVIGALLVLISVVVGVRVVAAADDTIAVLVASKDLSPGQPLTAELVETRQVGIDGAEQLYYTERLGQGEVVVRHVRAGELVPRSAVAAAADVATGEDAVRFVTLAVPIAEAPAGLSAGDTVDVWVTPAGTGKAKRLAAGLTVTDASSGGALGISGSHATVTLAVRAAAEDDLGELVGGLIATSRDGRVYLSKLPGRFE